MTSPRLTGTQARAVVEARLARPPQDALEAAVVLEAWAGVRAREALALGSDMLRVAPGRATASTGRPPEADRSSDLIMEALALVVAVLAIACWAGPLGDSLGGPALERAMLLALPVTLAAQWGLRSRYLSRRDGSAALARRRGTLIAAAAAAAGTGWLALGVSGLTAGLLVTIWTAGTLLIHRRWTPLYAGVIAVATAAMVSGASALPTIAVTAAVTSAAVVLALRGARAPVTQPPGPASRAVLAALIGGGLGVLVMGDGTVGWAAGGAAPAAALLPSTLASSWAGHHLWRFLHVIPRSLAGVPAAAVRDGGRSWAGVQILAGALARLTLLTVALSAALVIGSDWLDVATLGVSVLAGFGAVAIATLLLGLLESLGRSAMAVVAIAAGTAAEAAAPVLVGDPFSGVGLVAGASLCALIALPIAVVLLARSASTLATALWIS